MDTTQQLTTILHPYENSYSSGNIECQAVFGYTVYTNHFQHREVTEYVGATLSGGASALYARALLVGSAEELGFECSDVDPAIWRYMNVLTDVLVEGDGSTKLKTVYNGLNDFNPNWARPLP